MNKPGRLYSLDALRGFDMFFIVGGAELIKAFCKFFPSPFTASVAHQMTHTEWHGFTFYDMIFPLFLFIAGVSFPYSLARKRSMDVSTRNIMLSILKRGLILFGLGLVFNRFLAFDFEHIRYTSVLGRIGIAWMIAAAIFTFGGQKWSIGIGVFILMGYYVVCALIPSPASPPGASPFSIEGSIVTWLDVNYLPGRCLETNYDPLGILSTFPAIVTALLGIVTGCFLKNEKLSGNRKVIWLCCFSIGLIVIGLIWNNVFPINKKLWTSSYVCFAGGLSLLLLTLFYWVIDVLKFKKWSFFFTVIGLNSITIYMAQKIVDFSHISDFLGKGTVLLFPQTLQPLIHSIFYLIIIWSFLYILYRKAIFLKV
jgi:predicted acyltransferase